MVIQISHIINSGLLNFNKTINALIAVEEAKSLVTNHCFALSPIDINIKDSVDAVLAEDLFSPGDFPSFPQSAMDGYAIRFSDFAAGRSLQVIGEVQAGSGEKQTYRSNSAIRIFTGAPVPPDYDTVVMQEHCIRNGNELLIDAPNLMPGSNVRKRGAEIKKGELALKAGSLLTAGAVGFLIGLGISKANVYSKPTINILVTGKELVPVGNELQYGQVYESNGTTLQKAIQHLHFTNSVVSMVDDDPKAIEDQVNLLLSKSDLLLITGGVSVGDYDFVRGALEKAGVEIIFHRVKQKPGKPILFGKTKDCIVFGLPGNPSSVLTCFYEYVTLALQQLTGRKTPYCTELVAALSSNFQKPAGLTHFLKGKFAGNVVSLLPAQESFRLSSFAIANCLVQIPADVMELKENDMVTIQLLPV